MKSVTDAIDYLKYTVFIRKWNAFTIDEEKYGCKINKNNDVVSQELWKIILNWNIVFYWTNTSDIYLSLV